MIHILLPAYNEGKALGAVCEKITATLKKGTFQVWVVDDGSQDDTAAVAQDLSRRMPLTLLQHTVNGGLGKAFQTGLSRIIPLLAADDILVTLDADNTQPPSLIRQLVEPLENGRADVAIASRFAPGGQSVGVPLTRRLISWGASQFLMLFFPIPGVRDFTCGFRAYRGEIMLRATKRWGTLLNEAGFSVALEWLLKLSKLSQRMVEVPLVLRYDLKPTQSKMPVMQTIVRTMGMLWRLRWTPLT